MESGGAGDWDPVETPLIEGVARVVALDGRRACLEPEQGEACGACQSAALCGLKTDRHPRRLAARRFWVANDLALRLGERVVIGVSGAALLRASLVAYGVPLLAMLAAMVGAWEESGSNGITAVAAVAGLAVGFAAMRLGAGRLAAGGDLTPRVLRRALGSALDGACPPG